MADHEPYPEDGTVVADAGDEAGTDSATCAECGEAIYGRPREGDWYHSVDDDLDDFD